MILESNKRNKTNFFRLKSLMNLGIFAFKKIISYNPFTVYGNNKMNFMLFFLFIFSLYIFLYVMFFMLKYASFYHLTIYSENNIEKIL